MPTGVVSITRRCVPTSKMPDWDNCGAHFRHQKLHVTTGGTIEDQGDGFLQVDFANKFLGGGVLGTGCVQEEIRFVICPELFVTMLVTEAMAPNEAVFMVGCERYSNYTGYSSSFSFGGDFADSTPLDDSRRRQCAVVAIDALNFHKPNDQFREDLMLRELNKVNINGTGCRLLAKLHFSFGQAYAGYRPWLQTPAPAVATGNWGCGAFGGEPRLKALLQLMVCCAASRPLVYFTFGDRQLSTEFLQMYRFLRGDAEGGVRGGVTVAQLWSYLKRFREQRLAGDQLFAFVRQMHQPEHDRPHVVVYDAFDFRLVIF